MGNATTPVEEEHVPLVRRHIARLKKAHTHFAERDGKEVWVEWIGDEEVWKCLKARLEEVERAGRGDWRVSSADESMSLLIQTGSGIDTSGG